jgi:hypothetical protein
MTDAHSPRARIHQNRVKTDISLGPLNQHFGCIGLIVARLIAPVDVLSGLVVRVFLLRHVGRTGQA